MSLKWAISIFAIVCLPLARGKKQPELPFRGAFSVALILFLCSCSGGGGSKNSGAHPIRNLYDHGHSYFRFGNDIDAVDAGRDAVNMHTQGVTQITDFIRLPRRLPTGTRKPE